MTVTIASPYGSSTPVVWMQLATTRTSTSRIATDPGGHHVATIHGPRPRSRTSTLALLYRNETEARAAEDLHAAGGVLQITDTGRPTHSMRYIVSGQITRELDAESAALWILTVDVTEVPA